MPADNDISWLHLLLAFGTVAGLLAGLGYGLRFMVARGWTLSQPGTKSKRLQLVETLIVDAGRRLVIVRCDGREHLLLINGQNDIVIESNLNAQRP